RLKSTASPLRPYSSCRQKSWRLGRLVSGSSPRDRAPAGALSSKANRLTIDPSSHRTSKQSVCLDDFHGANKALSGTFGKSTHGWVRAEREPLPIADVEKSDGDSLATGLQETAPAGGYTLRPLVGCVWGGSHRHRR